MMREQNRLIALIPARGGSKRLPKKNIIPFRGRPIMAWTISAALETELFDRVVVSTDDESIARVAIDAGADVDYRDPNLATDTASVVDVCLDFLQNESDAGRIYDILCCLYATAPLRLSSDIKQTVNLVKSRKTNFAMAVTQFDLPAFQALKVGSDDKLIPMWPDLISKRSSDIGQLAVDNGSTYVVSVPEFQRVKSFYGPSLCGHLMQRKYSIDIDEASDLEHALLYADHLGFGKKD